MKVSDIMTSEGLATATLDTTLAEIATRMRDENVGAIPIVDDDEKLAGIITDRDIVVRGIAEGEDPNECTAEDIISEQLHTIHPEADLEDAAELMARHQIRRLPVVEDAVIVGMISLGDLAVKAEEDEASAALEDISEGVRKAGSTQGESGRRTQKRASVEDSETRGISERTGGVESTFSVASEEAQGEDEDEGSGRQASGRQLGGSRSSSSLAGRLRNWSRSQQTVAHEAQAFEGEDASDVISSTVEEGRQRSNQQDSPNTAALSARGRSSGTGSGTRASEGKPGSKGANLRSSNKASDTKASEKNSRSQTKTQGASNRSRGEEDKRQAKVTTMRSTGRASGRSKSKRKAS
jgi:CBS domain-containing protein